MIAMNERDTAIFDSILNLIEETKRPESRLFLGFSWRLKQGCEARATELFLELDDPDFEVHRHPAGDYDGPGLAITLATGLGLADAVAFLLDRGANVTFSDSHLSRLTALHLAAFNGDSGLCELLIRHGADTRASNHNGLTPLMAASRVLHFDDRRRETCGVLIDYGAEIEARDCFDFTCLMRAVDDGCVWAVEYFLSRGADMNATSREDATPLILSRHGHYPSRDIEQNLLSAGASEFADSELLYICRGLASSDEDIARAAAVMDGGANVNCVSLRDGATPLIAASSCRHNLGLVKLLLARGADPSARDSAGNNALRTAHVNGCSDIAEIMQEAAEGGSERAAVSADLDWELLSMVNKGTEISALAALIRKGASPLARDSSGRTPLHIAAARANAPVVGLLIEAGAEIDAVDGGGETPLMKAAQEPGSLNQVSIALAKVYVEIARTLIAAGANLSLKNDTGLAAADLSCWPRMTELLTRRGGFR